MVGSQSGWFCGSVQSYRSKKPHFSICNTFVKTWNKMLRKDPFDTLVQEMELGHTALGRGSEGWLEMKR